MDLIALAPRMEGPGGRRDYYQRSIWEGSEIRTSEHVNIDNSKSERHYPRILIQDHEIYRTREPGRAVGEMKFRSIHTGLCILVRSSKLERPSTEPRHGFKSVGDTGEPLIVSGCCLMRFPQKSDRERLRTRLTILSEQPVVSNKVLGDDGSSPQRLRHVACSMVDQMVHKERRSWASDSGSTPGIQVRVDRSRAKRAGESVCG